MSRGTDLDATLLSGDAFLRVLPLNFHHTMARLYSNAHTHSSNFLAANLSDTESPSPPRKRPIDVLKHALAQCDRTKKRKL